LEERKMHLSLASFGGKRRRPREAGKKEVRNRLMAVGENLVTERSGVANRWRREVEGTLASK